MVRIYTVLFLRDVYGVSVRCRSTRPYSKMSVNRPVETAVVLSRTSSASMAAPARGHDSDVSRINRQFPEFTSTFSPSSHALYQVWNNTVDMGEQGGTKLKQKSVWWINYCHRRLQHGGNIWEICRRCGLAGGKFTTDCCMCRLRSYTVCHFYFSVCNSASGTDALPCPMRSTVRLLVSLFILRWCNLFLVSCHELNRLKLFVSEKRLSSVDETCLLCGGVLLNSCMTYFRFSA